MEKFDLKNMFKETGWVVLLNLFAAILAFGKDLLFASRFGTDRTADVFWMAFFLPDTLGNNIFSPAMALSMVPMLSTIRRDDEAAFYGFTIRFTGWMTATALLVTLILYIMAGVLAKWLLPGDTAQFQMLFVKLFQILLPMMLWSVLTSSFTAALQSNGIFRAPAGAPLIVNMFACLVLVYITSCRIPTRFDIYHLAAAFNLGSLAAMLFLGFIVYRAFPRKGKAGQTWRLHHLATCKIGPGLRLFVSYFAILGGIQLMLLFERFIASRLAEGSVAALNYAYRLSQFPVWVCGAALAVVLLPTLSRMVDDGEQIRSLAKNICFLTLLFGIPVAVGFFLLREPLVTILFRRGSFGMDSVHMTTEILAGYSLTIPGQLGIIFGIRFFMARQKMARPVAAMALAMGINGVLDWMAAPFFQGAALGYGAAIASTVFALLLWFDLAGTQNRIDFQRKEGGKAGQILARSIFLGGMWFWGAGWIWQIAPGWHREGAAWLFVTIAFGGMLPIWWLTAGAYFRDFTRRWWNEK